MQTLKFKYLAVGLLAICNNQLRASDVTLPCLQCSMFGFVTASLPLYLASTSPLTNTNPRPGTQIDPTTEGNTHDTTNLMTTKPTFIADQKTVIVGSRISTFLPRAASTTSFSRKGKLKRTMQNCSRSRAIVFQPR